MFNSCFESSYYIIPLLFPSVFENSSVHTLEKPHAPNENYIFTGVISLFSLVFSSHITNFLISGEVISWHYIFVL